LNQQRNLSSLALEKFTDAEAGRAYIHIPSMVLYEVAILERQGRIKLNGGYMHWTRNLLSNDGFRIAPLEPVVISLAVGYGFNGDPFDRVVVATAADLSLPLITRDAAISNSDLVELVW
jgi:PIN domain nuclease of toxin-antitoxin system